MGEQIQILCNVEKQANVITNKKYQFLYNIDIYYNKWIIFIIFIICSLLQLYCVISGKIKWNAQRNRIARLVSGASESGSVSYKAVVIWKWIRYKHIKNSVVRRAAKLHAEHEIGYRYIFHNIQLQGYYPPTNCIRFCKL